MDAMTVVTLATAVVTAASVLLKVVAPLTANKKDDKVLAALNWILEKVSLNTNVEK